MFRRAFIAATLLGLALSTSWAFPPLWPVRAREPGWDKDAKQVRTFRPREVIVIRRASDIPKGVGRVYCEGSQWVWDGEHRWRLDGGLLRGNCDQKENQEALLRVFLPRFTLKNFFIYESKNGLLFDEGADRGQIIGCIFEKICEDAINPRNNNNGLVERCEFATAEDKVIQINNCRGWTVRDNTFRRARNAIRAMGSGVRAENNRFYNVDTAYHATRWNGHIRVVPGSDEFNGVKTRYKAEDGGRVTTLPDESLLAGTPAPPPQPKSTKKTPKKSGKKR